MIYHIEALLETGVWVSIQKGITEKEAIQWINQHGKYVHSGVVAPLPYGGHVFLGEFLGIRMGSS